ncbi:MAG: RNA methyltransferase [Desulfovibrio sp.]|nr:RNA methyltransferase [Desulfovibrio sp.]
MNEPAAQLLPGLKPVLELIELAPGRIQKIFLKNECRAAAKIRALALACGIPIVPADARQLDKLCAASPQNRISHQGVIALLKHAGPQTLADLLNQAAPLNLILALDQIQDPGNLGVLCRTAWALGCAGLLLPEHNSAPLGPAAMRSSAGSLAFLPTCVTANLARSLDEAEEAGFAIYGAGHASHITPTSAFQFAWPLPAVLVLGNENKGLRPGVAKRCAVMLAIPMARTFDSLNVAQAGAILMGLCAAAHAQA